MATGGPQEEQQEEVSEDHYCSVCLNVFHRHVLKLYNISDLDSLLVHFEEREIITIYQHLEIKDNKSTTEDKMQILLENISLPLESGYAKQFNLFVEILERHGVDDTKTIACAMKIEVQGFVQLRTHCNTIENSLPEDFMKTTKDLCECLTDVQITEILSCDEAKSANKKILQFLSEKLNCVEDLLNFCAQLEKISTSSQLNMVINNIKSSIGKGVESNVDAQPLPPPSDPHHSSRFDQDPPSSKNSVYSTITQSISLRERFSSTSYPEYQFYHSQLSRSRNVEVVEDGSLHSLTSSVTTGVAISDTSDIDHDDSDFEYSSQSIPYSYSGERPEFRYQSPLPSLPKHFVRRKYLLERITKTVCFDNFNPSEDHATLTLTGGGGFGKTTLVVAICHDQDVKDIFTNGIIYVDLGAQPCNPIAKLNDLYCRMIGRKFECNFIGDVEEKIKCLTKRFNNVLVIIDDVWEIEDAKLIVKAFCNCKTIVTTRITNIKIPSQETIDIGPMTLTEAIKVMTDNVIEYNILPQEDKKFINELAKNAHQWPLLLSLIRGQLSHSLEESTHAAIQSVYLDLLNKGLAAFDIKSKHNSRQYSVQACIKLSLDKLDESVKNKLKSVILFTGIGGSLPKGVLHCLWSVSKPDAKEIVSSLEVYGLVSNKSIEMPPFYCSVQSCLTIHSVISKYILDNISSEEVAQLSPFIVNTEQLIGEEAELVFRQYYGENIIDHLTKTEYLIYNKQKLEHVILPYYVKDINQHVVHDPHLIILILQNIQSFLTCSGQILELFNPQIVELISECRIALSHAQSLSRKYNMHFQLCCSRMNFDNLTATLAEYQETPFIKSVIINCIEFTENIVSCCDGKLQSDLNDKVKEMKYLTKDYHAVTSEKLPRLDLYTRLHSDISVALHKKRFDDINQIYVCLTSGKFEEDVELVHSNYEIKLQSLGAFSL